MNDSNVSTIPASMASFAGNANREARRTTRIIVIVAVLLAALMWLFIGGLVWSERESALQHGNTNGRNLAAALAVELTHTLDRINGAMDAILRRGPVGLDGTPRIAELAEWSKDFSLLAHPALHLGLIGVDGKLVFSNNPNQTGPNGSSNVDLSDREHFRIHRDRRDAGLYISVPLLGRVAEGYMLYFTKRIETPDGKFAGVLAFLVPPIELTRMHKRIDLGRRGVLAIIGTDDIVRVRVSEDRPNGEVGLGASVRGAPWPENVPPGGFGSYTRSGALTPVDRQFNYRRLDAYPLLVNIGLDLDDLLSEARGHAWVLAAIGAGMTALVAGLATLLIREIRRRTLRDIELAAERSRLEDARLVIQEEQTKLSQANNDLLTAVDRAEAANQAKSRFLAHMSHELRTPLHAIIGFSEIIHDRAPRAIDSAAITDYAADILASGRHLLELINAILDISKVESGTERLTEDTIRLPEVIRASLVSVGGLALQRGIKIGMAVQDDLPPLRADPTKLRQVLINLLSNAVKFTDEDGQVTISARIAHDGGLLISVSDTGIGMTEAEIEVALQPFGQVDNSLSRNFQGTGLGLPLAQRLTELHGGTLTVHSVKGDGTTIEVWLPAERVGPHVEA